MKKLTSILLGLAMSTTTFADDNSTSFKDDNSSFDIGNYSGTYYSCKNCLCEYDFSPVGIPNEEIKKIINNTGMGFGLALLEYDMRYRGVSERNIKLAKKELTFIDYTPLFCPSSMKIKPK